MASKMQRKTSLVTLRLTFNKKKKEEIMKMLRAKERIPHGDKDLGNGMARWV